MTFACFYLGTHQPHWLADARFARTPLFVSHRRLAGRRTLPRAAGRWALDSGGFSELSLFGGWATAPAAYVAAVRRYDGEIGGMDWAAPQDWMCEPVMLARTGLTIAEHQRRTVANYLDLTARWAAVSDADSPFMPVLQGWALADYEHCAAMYGEAGIDLRQVPVVGVGSVCRRQATGEIAEILTALAEADLWLHGFGMKTEGLRACRHLLTSADSMAWSFNARRARAPMPGCAGHKNCANCPRYALAWRDRVLAAGVGPVQLRLGAA
jgi:hypothetical protein